MQPDQFAPLVRAAFGGARRLVGVERLRGGTRKGVFRLHLDDDSSVVLYRWSAAENYWPDETRPADPLDPANPFAAGEGPQLFLANQRLLSELGVPTPRVLLLDPGHELLPDDFALVSDGVGGRLEELLADAPVAAGPVLDELVRALTVMHRHTAPGFGKVLLVESGYRDRRRAERVVLERALRQLGQCVARVPEIAAAGPELVELLHARAAAIEPRERYGLIHGELGPDHVLLDADRRPMLIDIEGLMYFDVEWEHVFLRIRFGEQYPRLSTVELDPARLALYELAQHLSLVAGPLRLLDGDFPDREFMLAIVAGNQARVLAAVGRQG